MVNTYKNNFGELTQGKLNLIINEQKQTINLKNLVKIRFVKRQKYHVNYIAFLLSIYLLLFLKNNDLPHYIQIIISSITAVLLVASYFFKTYQYRFMVIRKNDFTEIIVSKKMSEDAENLAFQINKLEKASY